MYTSSCDVRCCCCRSVGCDECYVIIEKGRKEKKQCGLIFHFVCIFSSLHPSIRSARRRCLWVGWKAGKVDVESERERWMRQTGFFDGYKKDHTQKKISCWVFAFAFPFLRIFFFIYFFSRLLSTPQPRLARTLSRLRLYFTHKHTRHRRRRAAIFRWNMKMSVNMCRH